MNQMYCLSFYSKPNGDDCEGFYIGIFKTYAEAEKIAAHYKTEISGFKDYDDCIASIKEVPLIGKYNDQKTLYRYEGWNEDEDYNEVDIIESDYYVSEEDAKRDYISAKNKYFRQNWCCNSYTIGECGWKEGFERVVESQYISENECYTYFKIIGEFDPNEITERLALQPDETRRIGDLRCDESEYDSAVWIFGRCDEYTPYIEKQMRKTVGPLLEKIDILKDIYGQYDVDYVLEIVPTICPNEMTPVLAPPLDIIDFCHATRTEIDIDLYIADGDAEIEWDGN